MILLRWKSITKLMVRVFRHEGLPCCTCANNTCTNLRRNFSARKDLLRDACNTSDVSCLTSEMPYVTFKMSYLTLFTPHLILDMLHPTLDLPYIFNFGCIISKSRHAISNFGYAVSNRRLIQAKYDFEGMESDFGYMYLIWNMKRF